MNILIIEDDQSVGELERDYLEMSGGFHCTLCTDGTVGLQEALAGDWAMVIVDVMLPGLSGFEICRRLREEKDHIQRYQRLVGGREKPKEGVLHIRGLEIDRAARRVWVNGREQTMTGKEYDLLLFLAENPDTVFSKDRLFSRVWGTDACGAPSTVTVHIKHIRDKIETNPDHIQYIETVWGVGYRFRG